MLQISKLVDNIKKNGNAYVFYNNLSGISDYRDVVSLKVDENGELDVIHFIASKDSMDSLKDEVMFEMKGPLKAEIVLYKSHIGDLDDTAIETLGFIVSHTLYDGISLGTYEDKPKASTDSIVFAMYDVASKIARGTSYSRLASIVKNRIFATFDDIVLNPNIEPLQVSSIEEIIPSLEIQFHDFMNRTYVVSETWKRLNESKTLEEYNVNLKEWKLLSRDRSVPESSKTLKKFNKKRLNSALRI